MGNVYMEAEQVRFKDSTYHNLQTAVKAALEGGGGGGSTVVANPEGSATADLAKLQVGTTIYGIPAEAGDISYDNTSSGMTADDVQEAIDELNTGIGGITELIPSDATSSNKLATADDIPDAVTGNPTGTATAGDLAKLQIGSDIYSIPSGSTPVVRIYKASGALDTDYHNCFYIEYGNMRRIVCHDTEPAQLRACLNDITITSNNAGGVALAKVNMSATTRAIGYASIGLYPISQNYSFSLGYYSGTGYPITSWQDVDLENPGNISGITFDLVWYT